MKPAEYWELTYGEFSDCIKGHRDRTEAGYRLQDNLNHILGQYISAAVHTGKKGRDGRTIEYPKEPFLANHNQSRDEKQKHLATTDAQRIRYARIKYGKG